MVVVYNNPVGETDGLRHLVFFNTIAPVAYTSVVYNLKWKKKKKKKKWLCAQRRLRSAWASVSSLCAQWVAKDPSFLHADSEDSDQTGRMPRLMGAVILLVLSWGSSNEPRHERTCRRGLWPSNTQTCLFSYRDRLGSWNFGFSK